ncbi:hypothetical protein CIPAW_03G031000 [Carya illinoinensis]|uniref:Glucose/Sorbosone dehydrogenase domain-containing protein n=1 Tax=Carya illinoinensis TaxID=32201 RepID=A0A8T1QY82_CARIL|nr:hypothetical protein CIPAW_03G031000 [Carya illinoinensis]
MRGVLTITFVLSQLLLINLCFSHPLCTNMSRSMNVSDVGCTSLLKSILCAFSAELYRIESAPRKVPVLCNSTVSANSPQSQLTEVGFCSKVWDECKNVSISNSLFPLQDRGGVPLNSTTKMADIWLSKSAFCNEFGGASEYGAVCFDGGTLVLNHTENLTPPSGICLEKIGNGSYLNMVAHPNGTNQVFLSHQPGKIWLATVPEEGSGELLTIDESNPFLDLTDQVYSESEFGLMGIAFHPNFQENGRFFASFNCDKVQWPECSGRCSCNLDLGCDPSKLDSDNGAQPCQYSSVIAEFTANSSTSQPSSVNSAWLLRITSIKPKEVKRIFTIGLPFTSHHGGQILFGPEDGYLYFMMGDGGSVGDPYNFAQNKKSLLGKILRLDIDNMPNAEVVSDLDLWGNYSEQYEEVDIVTKGGNYGWRIYEGPFLYNPPTSPGGNTSARSIDPIFPVMGYNHSDVNKALGSASITGGYFYWSMNDPCMYGRSNSVLTIHYLYADLYGGGGGMWAGTESGNFSSTHISITCARDSPIQCSTEVGISLPSASLGYIFSFGEHNSKDLFTLASLVVRPSRCNYNCSKENVTDLERPTSAPSPPPSNASGRRLAWILLHLFIYL